MYIVLTCPTSRGLSCCIGESILVLGVTCAHIPSRAILLYRYPSAPANYLILILIYITLESKLEKGKGDDTSINFFLASRTFCSSCYCIPTFLSDTNLYSGRSDNNS